MNQASQCFVFEPMKGEEAASPFHPYSMGMFHSEVCVIPEWLLEVTGTESDADIKSIASGRNKVILNKFANARHDWVDYHNVI